MAKKLSEEQVLELTHMKDWCLEILNYLIEKDGSSVWREVLGIITKAHDRGNLRDIRQVFRDINEMSNSLSTSDKLALNRLLFDRFGKNLLTESKRNLARIQRVIEVKKIRTEVEYRLVLEHIDHICAFDKHRTELTALQMLLLDYDRKKGVGNNERP